MVAPSRMSNSRRAKYAQKKPPFTITADMSALDRLLDALATDVEEAARPAAQAGAQVLYDEVLRNVDRLGRKSGRLRASIYQVFSKDNSGPGKATYHVSWNARKAPHGHLLEYGHIQKYQVVLTKSGKWVTMKKRPLATPRHVAASPFVRPAASKFGTALAAAEAELLRRIGAL